MTTPDEMRNGGEAGGDRLPLRPIDRRSLADEIAERVREVVLAGALRAGEKVSDSRLAQELGVGRSTMREAFRILLSEGLLESSGHGVRVAQVTVDDVQDTFELRLAVECRAARMVAERCDPRHRPCAAVVRTKPTSRRVPREEAGRTPAHGETVMVW